MPFSPEMLGAFSHDLRISVKYERSDIQQFDES